MPSFVASRWSGDDNSVFPDRLEIDSTNVTYFKGTIIGYRATIIARDNIASVHRVSGLLFADIVIESTGGLTVRAKGFKKHDARTIMSLLT